MPSFLISHGSSVIDTGESTTTDKDNTDHLRDGSIIGIVGMIFLIVILLCVSFIFGIWWKRNKRPRRYNRVTPSDLVTLERKILANRNNNNNNINLYSNDLFNKDSYDNFYSQQQQQQQQQNHYHHYQQQQQKYDQYNNNTTTTDDNNNNNNNNNSNINTNISSTSSFPIITSPSPTLKRDKIRNTDTWERYLKMINNPNRLNYVVNSKRTVDHNNFNKNL